eukprot:UN01792
MSVDSDLDKIMYNEKAYSLPLLINKWKEEYIRVRDILWTKPSRWPVSYVKEWLQKFSFMNKRDIQKFVKIK